MAKCPRARAVKAIRSPVGDHDGEVAYPDPWEIRVSPDEPIDFT